MDVRYYGAGGKGGDPFSPLFYCLVLASTLWRGVGRGMWEGAEAPSLPPLYVQYIDNQVVMAL